MRSILNNIKLSQMRIQQMAFMIVAVLFFFVLVGLGYVGYQTKTLKSNYLDLQKEAAISSLQVLTDMPELTCGSLCLDEDKLQVMTGKSREYKDIWGVSSIKVVKVYPAFTNMIKCPNLNCNYYDVYDSGLKQTKQYSTFVSLCKKIKDNDYIYDKCEIAKLLVGVKVLGESE